MCTYCRVSAHTRRIIAGFRPLAGPLPGARSPNQAGLPGPPRGPQARAREERLSLFYYLVMIFGLIYPIFTSVEGQKALNQSGRGDKDGKITVLPVVNEASGLGLGVGGAGGLDRGPAGAERSGPLMFGGQVAWGFPHESKKMIVVMITPRGALGWLYCIPRSITLSSHSKSVNVNL